MYIVRRRISLPSEKAMFLFVNKVLPTTRYGLLKYLTTYLCVLQMVPSLRFQIVLLFFVWPLAPQWGQSIQKIGMKMDSFMLHTVERTLSACDFPQILLSFESHPATNCVLYTTCYKSHTFCQWCMYVCTSYCKNNLCNTLENYMQT